MPYREFDVSDIGKIKIYKRKNNRSLRITITADGEVRVTIPTWTPFQAGLAFTHSKRDWVMAQRRKRDVAPLTNGLRIGKSHHLFFRQSSATNTVKSSVRQTEIIITYSPSLSDTDTKVQAVAQAACLRALRLQAASLLGQRLSQLAAKSGIVYRDLVIKRMKTRWGSCDQNSNIVLNLYLVQLPWELIDYVIMHELTHTRVLHHGSRFWNELEGLHPKTPQFRKELKMYRPTLIVA